MYTENKLPLGSHKKWMRSLINISDTDRISPFLCSACLRYSFQWHLQLPEERTQAHIGHRKQNTPHNEQYCDIICFLILEVLLWFYYRYSPSSKVKVYLKKTNSKYFNITEVYFVISKPVSALSIARYLSLEEIRLFWEAIKAMVWSRFCSCSLF